MNARTRSAALVAATALIVTAAVAGCSTAPKSAASAGGAGGKAAEQPLGGNVQVNPVAPANSARQAVGAANSAIDQQQQSVPTQQP